MPQRDWLLLLCWPACPVILRIRIRSSRSILTIANLGRVLSAVDRIFLHSFAPLSLLCRYRSAKAFAAKECSKRTMKEASLPCSERSIVATQRKSESTTKSSSIRVRTVRHDFLAWSTEQKHRRNRFQIQFIILIPLFQRQSRGQCWITFEK
jgi:hypothetical protein